VKLLERLGVREPVERVAGRVERATLIFDDLSFEMNEVLDVVGAPMLNARRVTLDAILLEAAAEAGADVRTGAPVTGLVRERGRVSGVELRDERLRADLVIGADGARSTVARLAGAREYASTRGERGFLWGYFEGAQADPARLWLGETGGTGYLASFTDADLFMAAVTMPLDGWAGIRADRAAAHAGALRGWPDLHACLAGARRVGPVQAMANWHGFFREATGPGWALVGDAGHFKDPTPGQGIADALRQVFALAPAIEQALGGREHALHDWWRWRDRDAWEMYWFAHDMGAAEPPPRLVREMQRRIAREPELGRGLMHVLNHDVPPSAVFTPRILLATMVRAMRAGVAPRRQLLREAATLVARTARRELAGRRQPAFGGSPSLGIPGSASSLRSDGASASGSVSSGPSGCASGASSSGRPLGMSSP
jgi:2-polyprenyl-6-methoxyphenol hydroxylase-like FAD-dependent oxidoreductase